jgi:regulator of cell morphogenesis and NO signaling
MHILDKHHVYTKREMPRLETLLVKVIAVHGDNHPELLQVARQLRTLCEDLKPHMFKEEQILFPYFVQVERSLLRHTPAPFAPPGTADNPALVMMREHERVAELLRELREASANYKTPADGCLSYQMLNQGLEALEKDLHQHMHLENNVLFPRATEMERRM